MSFGVLPLSIFFIVLLIVPGLVGIDLLLLRANRSDNFDRVKTIAYSVLISLVSLFILYLMYPSFVDFGHIELIQNIANDYNLPEQESIEAFNLPLYVFGYLTHFLLAGTLGFVGGHLLLWASDKSQDRRSAWDYTLDAIHNGESIRVKTTEGKVIEGVKVEKAHNTDNPDILLQNPQFVGLTEEWNNGESNDNDGSEISDYVYIPSDSVEQVFFIDELDEKDLDTVYDKSSYDNNSGTVHESAYLKLVQRKARSESGREDHNQVSETIGGDKDHSHETVEEKSRGTDFDMLIDDLESEMIEKAKRENSLKHLWGEDVNIDIVDFENPLFSYVDKEDNDDDES